MDGEVVKLYALDKDDLLFLVNGNVPSYDIFDHPLIKDRGTYYDSIGWEWDIRVLSELQTHELYMIHKLCKDSWKQQKGGN